MVIISRDIVCKRNTDCDINENGTNLYECHTHNKNLGRISDITDMIMQHTYVTLQVCVCVCVVPIVIEVEYKFYIYIII